MRSIIDSKWLVKRVPNNGWHKVKNNKVILMCIISIATGGALYALGQRDVSRLVMKRAFGTAIACGAATLAGFFGAGNVSGGLFF